jgi:hypothetical protein
MELIQHCDTNLEPTDSYDYYIPLQFQTHNMIATAAYEAMLCYSYWLPLIPNWSVQSFKAPVTYNWLVTNRSAIAQKSRRLVNWLMLIEVGQTVTLSST